MSGTFNHYQSSFSNIIFEICNMKLILAFRNTIYVSHIHCILPLVWQAPDITATVSCFLTSTLMPILASYSDYVTVTYITFLYTCSLSLAAVAFLAFSAGVSIHTDRSPSSVCVERNFLGSNPVVQHSS